MAKTKTKKTLFGGTKTKTVSYDDQGRKIVTKVKRRKSGKIRKTKTRISRKGSLGSEVSKEKFDKSGKLRKTVESINLPTEGMRTVGKRGKEKTTIGGLGGGYQKGGEKYVPRVDIYAPSREKETLAQKRKRKMKSTQIFSKENVAKRRKAAKMKKKFKDFGKQSVTWRKGYQTGGKIHTDLEGRKRYFIKNDAGLDIEYTKNEYMALIDKKKKIKKGNKKAATPKQTMKKFKSGGFLEPRIPNIDDM